MRVRIQDLMHKAGYGIWIMSDNIGTNRGTHVAKPVNLEFEYKGESFLLPEPTLEIPYAGAQEFLQSLCNALIQMGVRPDTDRIAGELEATKVHLKNLQDIVNKTLLIIDKE